MTKSRAMWNHGLLGMGNGMSLSVGSVLGVLHWEHTEQNDTKMSMSLCIVIAEYWSLLRGPCDETISDWSWYINFIRH